MEQDSAKIIEKNGKWLVDYNRSGMPLLEIITETQFTNPEDCKLVVREMQEMLSTLGVSEASIEQGSMRVDVNLSVYDTTSSDVDQNKNVGNSDLTHLLRTPNIEI
jgi:aspartyl-tRNA(Asn)/glutamyl-tRNA(Gln) amidotransferase subunit B